MKVFVSSALVLGAVFAVYSCKDDGDDDGSNLPSPQGTALVGDLPPPDPSHDAKNLSQVTGWPAGKIPTAPAGFVVTKFAGGLDNPRNVYELPNGDVLVVESNTVPQGAQEVNLDPSKNARRGTSANRITLLRDADKDGVAETSSTLLQNLNQPFGVLFLNNVLYVANTDNIQTYPFTPGQTTITASPTQILELPKGGYNNHWTRNLLLSADGKKIYVSVGSASNIAEHGISEENRRANILEINPDGSGERVFASGLRNPVGLALSPETRSLYAVVNERDLLGDDLVPDYLTMVADGGFYGWPYSYFGSNPDPRLAGQRPDLVAVAIKPDVDLGAHTASLGLAFGNDKMPEGYKNGAFVGQHGSWNRTQLAGYRVAYVPFESGRPSAAPQDFLTGFVADAATSKVYGRPMSLAVTAEGTLLVADDSGDTIWAVKPAK